MILQIKQPQHALCPYPYPQLFHNQTNIKATGCLPTYHRNGLLLFLYFCTGTLMHHHWRSFTTVTAVNCITSSKVIFLENKLCDGLPTCICPQESTKNAFIHLKVCGVGKMFGMGCQNAAFNERAGSFEGHRSQRWVLWKTCRPLLTCCRLTVNFIIIVILGSSTFISTASNGSQSGKW